MAMCTRVETVHIADCLGSSVQMCLWFTKGHSPTVESFRVTKGTSMFWGGFQEEVAFYPEG